MPASLSSIQRIALVAAVPLVIFLVAAGISFGTGGDDELPTTSAPPAPTSTRAVSAAASTAVASPAAAAQPTATALPDRTDCNAIRGTDYRSVAEQNWFKTNCSGTSPATAGSTSSGTTSSGTTSAAPRTGSSAGVQAPTGSRLVIPAAGIDTSIYGVTVSASAGILPDPTCYFCAVEYDLSAFGLGNRKVLGGHVDCATCHNGSSGIAVFWGLTHGAVGPGHEIQYYSGGTVFTFVVTAVNSYSPNVDVLALASGADMTLITCGGTFVAGEYTNRTFVFANLKKN